MHAVVIHHWQEATPELLQKLAAILGVTAFDTRQRLIGKGPAVVASFAEPGLARLMQVTLGQNGFQAFVVNASALSKEKPNFVVQRFILEDEGFSIANVDGCKGAIAYNRIRLLLPALRISLATQTSTVTERKFSMGKTLLAGGLPMMKKISHKQVVSTEAREKVLYLCVGERTRVVCPQDGMAYNGLGEEMRSSVEINFNTLVAKLRQRCPSAIYDERLLKRTEQARLLGPLLNPDRYLDLAVEILTRGCGR